MRMDRERIDARIDRAAEAAKEAVDLLAGRIDAATRCARGQHARAGNRMKETTPRAADAVEGRLPGSARRIRERVKQKE